MSHNSLIGICSSLPTKDAKASVMNNSKPEPVLEVRPEPELKSANNNHCSKSVEHNIAGAYDGEQHEGKGE